MKINWLYGEDIKYSIYSVNALNVFKKKILDFTCRGLFQKILF